MPVYLVMLPVLAGGNPVAARGRSPGAGQRASEGAVSLAQVTEVLAGAGGHEQAVVVAGQAEEVARSITSLGSRARALAQVARALAGAGQYRFMQVIVIQRSVMPFAKT